MKVQPFIITASELPPWYEKQRFIYSGYRNPEAHSTYTAALSSVYRWHNETLNIHTHLWAAISFCVLFYLCIHQEFYVSLSFLSKVCVVNGFAAAIIMGLASAFAHTFYIINKEWYDFSWKVDMVGIVTVLYSHIISDTYIITVLLLHNIKLFYFLNALSFFFGAYCIRKVFVENNIFLWAIIYGFVGSFPFTGTLFYFAFSGPYNYALQSASILSLYCSLSCVLAATVFYIAKIPERYWPHIVLKSHALHHIFITIGIYFALTVILYLKDIEEFSATLLP